jgi:hypothetical protein
MAAGSALATLGVLAVWPMHMERPYRTGGTAIVTRSRAVRISGGENSAEAKWYCKYCSIFGFSLQAGYSKICLDDPWLPSLVIYVSNL